MLIEILMPDFQGRLDLVNKIIQAQPAVYAHNIETVERLTPRVRDRRAGYQQFWMYWIISKNRIKQIIPNLPLC